MQKKGSNHVPAVTGIDDDIRLNKARRVMGFFRIPNQPEAKIKWHTNETIKKNAMLVSSMALNDGGGGEIRTLGRFPVGGFQDRCLKPLGHPSAMTCTIVPPCAL